MRETKSAIDAYIAKLPEDRRSRAREMRAILKRVAPKAKEVIKWHLPMFEEDRILFAFGAYKQNLNFMPTPAALRPFAKELKAYKTGKGSIQFPYDKPLPKGLITKIAKYRIKDVHENDARWM